ncbi:hypothetical protein [Nocardia transvalensis]|uniref:hypothetical protein n=1 Tax=Nocardia transvalensis TaxID=37333 RepID=UPI001892F527|nr:hypothetical protein [Nocardia transvalensis]MBF6333640.1 hypothetical protein [Nocardia transvalensis]
MSAIIVDMTLPAGDQTRSPQTAAADNDDVTGIELERLPRTPDEWVEDLDWHRDSYRYSKFQWTPEDALLIATRWTRGQDTFTNVADLATLTQRQLELGDYTETCQRALGKAIAEVQRGLQRPMADVADLLGLTQLECDEAVYLATVRTLWSTPASPIPDSNAQVRRIRTMCDGMFFASPLLLAWELKQLWRMYQSAYNLLEDTVVDLIVELDSVDPVAVAHASGMPNTRSLKQRIQTQRSERGEPGDPRRDPRQVF